MSLSELISIDQISVVEQDANLLKQEDMHALIDFYSLLVEWNRKAITITNESIEENICEKSKNGSRNRSNSS